VCCVVCVLWSGVVGGGWVVGGGLRVEGGG